MPNKACSRGIHPVFFASRRGDHVLRSKGLKLFLYLFLPRNRRGYTLRLRHQPLKKVISIAKTIMPVTCLSDYPWRRFLVPFFPARYEVSSPEWRTFPVSFPIHPESAYLP
jgi:hypothetical protein